jgi:hypothetical protein
MPFVWIFTRVKINLLAPMHIRQNAEVKSAVLEKGHELTVDTVKKVNYVHVSSIA